MRNVAQAELLAKTEEPTSRTFRTHLEAVDLGAPCRATFEAEKLSRRIFGDQANLPASPLIAFSEGYHAACAEIGLAMAKVVERFARFGAYTSELRTMIAEEMPQLDLPGEEEEEV